MRKSYTEAIQESTDDEEQEDDDESMIGEQSRSAEGQVSVRDLRRSQRGKKTFKHFGQNIYEQWLYCNSVLNQVKGEM